MLYESEKTEFKSELTSDLYKEVIAFANTEGGTIFIGVNNSGDITPLDNIDDIYTRATNGIRDAIAPDVTIFVKYILENNQIIRIEVGEGSYKPYYLRSKGMKPSGVYVRQGSSSVQASPEQIRQMIKDADGDVFEELRSLNQELTFDFCSETFALHSIAFNDEKFNVLGIRNHAQQLYTNLGLLLSDQCTHTIKIAVFSDELNTIFRDRKEFDGSVLRQLEESFDYLQLNNKNRSVIDGITRKDYWDYPKDAIREALLNAIIHRDYSFSGSIIININDTCIEFISIGGLLYGISIEDIRNGISQLRNQKLADVFLRLNFIESYGTGIRRIFSLYEGCSVLPIIEVTPNSFKITLPNMNMTSSEAVSSSKMTITPQVQTLLEYLEKHHEASDEDIQKLLGIKRTRTFHLVKQMADAKMIKVEGRGKNKKITLPK